MMSQVFGKLTVMMPQVLGKRSRALVSSPDSDEVMGGGSHFERVKAIHEKSRLLFLLHRVLHCYD